MLISCFFFKLKVQRMHSLEISFENFYAKKISEWFRGIGLELCWEKFVVFVSAAFCFIR